MAKGSVRKKGKKWYYRFYIEDESGNRVQKESPAPKASPRQKPFSVRQWRTTRKRSSWRSRTI